MDRLFRWAMRRAVQRRNDDRCHGQMHQHKHGPVAGRYAAAAQRHAERRNQRQQREGEPNTAGSYGEPLEYGEHTPAQQRQHSRRYPNHTGASIHRLWRAVARRRLQVDSEQEPGQEPDNLRGYDGSDHGPKALLRSTRNLWADMCTPPNAESKLLTV